MAINLAKLNKDISALKRATTRQRDTVQSLALIAAEHAAESGDFIYLTRLTDAMGQGMNRAGFLAWLKAFLPVVLRPAKEGAKDTFLSDGKRLVLAKAKEGEFNLSGMAEVMWWTFKAEQLAVEYDAEKAILGAITTYFTRQEGGEKPVKAGQGENLRLVEGVLQSDDESKALLRAWMQADDETKRLIASLLEVGVSDQGESRVAEAA